MGRGSFALGRRAEAMPAYRHALDRYEKLVTDFPAVPEYRQGLAGNHHNLGTLLRRLAQRPPAEEAFRRAMTS